MQPSSLCGSRERRESKCFSVQLLVQLFEIQTHALLKVTCGYLYIFICIDTLHNRTFLFISPYAVTYSAVLGILRPFSQLFRDGAAFATDSKY